MAHHPEKFLDGRMLWRGRIYSPLPFVRSLWGARINAGVWGTAAFPSVYRTDVHPFAFLPHSIRWQVISFVLTLAGAGRRGDRRASLGGGAAARHRAGRHRRDDRRRTSPTRSRSDVDSLPRQPAVVPRDGRLPAFPPAVRAHPRPDPRRAVAAGSGAAGRRAADQPRPAAVARRSVARAAAAAPATSPRIASGARRGRSTDRVLTRADRLAAALARGPADRHRRGLVATIATSACSSAAGPGSTSARWSRSTAAARRCCASARTCGRPASASSAPWRSAAALLGGGDRRPGAALAAGRRGRRRLLASGDRRVRRLADRAGHRHRAARRRRRSPIGRGMVAMQSGPARRAADRAVAAAHLRPAQRGRVRRR